MTPHKKRIDYLAEEYAKVPVATFVRAVNDCHYRGMLGIMMPYRTSPMMQYLPGSGSSIS